MLFPEVHTRKLFSRMFPETSRLPAMVEVPSPTVMRPPKEPLVSEVIYVVRRPLVLEVPVTLRFPPMVDDAPVVRLAVMLALPETDMLEPNVPNVVASPPVVVVPVMLADPPTLRFPVESR